MTPGPLRSPPSALVPLAAFGALAALAAQVSCGSEKEAEQSAIDRNLSNNIVWLNFPKFEGALNIQETLACSGANPSYRVKYSSEKIASFVAESKGETLRFFRQVSAGSSCTSVTFRIENAPEDLKCEKDEVLITANAAGTFHKKEVDFTCTWSSALGGKVSGLKQGSSVELEVADENTVTVSKDGDFTFPQKVTSDTSYKVKVKTQPQGQ